MKYISPEGMKLLTEYSWPGNIRELENSLERVVLILDKKILEKEDLLTILKETMEHHRLAKTDPVIPAVNQTEDASPATATQPSGNSIDLFSEVKTLKELEYKAIVAGLARTNWNLTLTAQQLGISRMTLYRKLDLHDLRQKD